MHAGGASPDPCQALQQQTGGVWSPARCTCWAGMQLAPFTTLETAQTGID